MMRLQIAHPLDLQTKGGLATPCPSCPGRAAPLAQLLLPARPPLKLVANPHPSHTFCRGPSLTVVPAQTVLGINQKTDVTVALDNTLGPLNNAVVTITLGAALTGSVDAGSPCTQTGQVITCPGTIAGEPRLRAHAVPG